MNNELIKIAKKVSNMSDGYYIETYDTNGDIFDWWLHDDLIEEDDNVGPGCQAVLMIKSDIEYLADFFEMCEDFFDNPNPLFYNNLHKSL